LEKTAVEVFVWNAAKPWETDYRRQTTTQGMCVRLSLASVGF